ncbi:hypothetical protein TCE0_041r13735 [Talaromyces pinophilus]|uniref:Uncharacterized protein n=1 Tax=Talaromyces pinophilus TaxID=128442 RepID=A0A6V8HN68_TALPI|nr:hypothetical protein TCE0_041r13735 [Talaromyces pinophilus]
MATAPGQTKPDGSYTPVQSFPSSAFTDEKALYQHAQNILLASDFHQEIVYTGVTSQWADTVLSKLDEDPDVGYLRKHYNSVTKTVWIRTMPTTIHDCHQRWFEQSEKAWYIAGQLTQAEFVNITHYAGTTTEWIGGPYAGSRKEPDLGVQVDNLSYPTFVIETGWSESLARLRDDMNLWLVGSSETNIVIILKWRRVANTIQVKGDLEVYRRDRNGIPSLQQSEVIFPAPPQAQAQLQQVLVSRRELFGRGIFQGSNANDVFSLPLDELRTVATEALARMRLLPA